MSYRKMLTTPEAPRDGGASLIQFPASVARSFVSCGVPALPATCVMLELLLNQPVIDLRSVSQLVLSDLGATLQILRAGSEEWDPDERQSCRIHARLVALGRDGIRQAIPSFTALVPHSRWSAAIKLWEHSRLVAECARLIAPGFAGVDPEQGYLAGLLHEIGRLPALLGPCGPPQQSSAEAVAEYLIKEWSLPGCVTGRLTPPPGPDTGLAQITRVVAVAHELVRLEGSSRLA